MTAEMNHSVTRDLLAYALAVVHLAPKHGDQGWLAYNTLFQQQLAVGAENQWKDINTTLLAATVLLALDDGLAHTCSR